MDVRKRLGGGTESLSRGGEKKWFGDAPSRSRLGYRRACLQGVSEPPWRSRLGNIGAVRETAPEKQQ